MRDNDDDRYDQGDFDRPQRRPESSGGGSGVKTVVIVLGVVLALGVLGVGAVVGLLMYSVQKVRQAAVTATASNDLKQIALGLHNYESVKGALPPPALPTRGGKPGLSWRVAILPYIEQYSLYQQFKLDEPWDSPNNLPLLDQMPRLFAVPGEPLGNTTHFRVFVGNGAVFDRDKKIRLAAIPDGSSNTLMVVETTAAVPWTKPDEIDYDPKAPLPALGLPNRDFVLVAMADGSVQRISKKCGTTSWHAAIRRDDGQFPGADFGP